VGSCRKDPVEPGLLVFASGGGECGAGELLIVEAVGAFLWIVGTQRKGPFKRLRPGGWSMSARQPVVGDVGTDDGAELSLCTVSSAGKGESHTRGTRRSHSDICTSLGS
jgi:hypothetical protein